MKKILILSLIFVILILNLFLISAEDEYKHYGNLAGFGSTGYLQISGYDKAPNSVEKISEYEFVIKNPETKIKYKEKDIEREFKYLEKDSKFKFKDGSLFRANFVVSNDASFCNGNSCTLGSAEYKLGDYVYRIESGSKVEYEKGKNDKPDIVKIIQKDGEVYQPKKIEGINKPKETEISYDMPKDAKDGENLFIKNDKDKYKLIKRKDLGFELRYDTERKRFFIKGAQQIDNLEIGAMQSSDVYLFLGEKIRNFDKPAIELEGGNNPNIKLSTPAGDKGFTVKILPGDKKYAGLDIKKDQNLVLWAVGGGKDFGTQKEINSNSEIKLENVNGKTLVNTKGAFRIFNGNKLIIYNEHTDSKVKVKVLDEKLISTGSGEKDVEFDFTKSDAVPMQIHVKDKDGKDITYKDLTGKIEDTDIFVVTDENNNQGSITTGKSYEDIGNRAIINSLSSELTKVWRGLTPNEQTKLLGSKDINGDLAKIKADSDRRVEEEKKKIAEESKKKEINKINNEIDNLASRIDGSLKNIPISRNVISQLENAINDKKNIKHGHILNRLNNVNGDSRVIALIFGSSTCNYCTDLYRVQSQNTNGLVYKITWNSGGVGLITANTQSEFKKNTGINPDQVNNIIGVSYPHTFFIDTQNGRIIGSEKGNNVNFNKYFKYNKKN